MYSNWRNGKSKSWFSCSFSFVLSILSGHGKAVCGCKTGCKRMRCGFTHTHTQFFKLQSRKCSRGLPTLSLDISLLFPPKIGLKVAVFFCNYSSCPLSFSLQISNSSLIGYYSRMCKRRRTVFLPRFYIPLLSTKTGVRGRGVILINDCCGIFATFSCCSPAS